MLNYKFKNTLALEAYRVWQEVWKEPEEAQMHKWLCRLLLPHLREESSYVEYSFVDSLHFHRHLIASYILA